jgi:hypothetical protein
MLFFQIILLGGYLYAHLLSVCLKARAQVITHTVLLAASLLFLPISPSDSWKPTSDQSPLLHILLLLLATVGGPYFMLSSTGPLMQKWFSQTSPGRSPYRLYALSNTGSLLALLSYPFVFEPWLTLRHQVFSWSAVYGGYVLLAGWCAAGLWKVSNSEASLVTSTETNSAELTTAADNRVPRPGIASMLLWLGLAASSSAMLLATTNQLCIDVATVPFLWVLPLGLYLISFIICFDSPQWYDRRAWGLLLIVCCPVACWVIDEGADVNITKQIVIYSTILFACCMTCHGELVSSKPHPKHLTLFFVLTSAGGALGGVFVAIVAPYLFKGYWEYHIGLVACALMTLLAWCGQRAWLRGPSPQFWIWTLTVTCRLYPLCILADFLIDQRQERSYSRGGVHAHPIDRFDRNRRPRTKSAGIPHCGDGVLRPSVCVDLLVWQLEISWTCRHRIQDSSGPDPSCLNHRRISSLRTHSHSQRKSTPILDTWSTLRGCRRSYLHDAETRMAGKLANLFAGLYGCRSSTNGMVFNRNSRP